MKHTPGPWKVYRAFSTDANAGYIRYIKAENMEHVAHVCDFQDGIEEAKANARLIAAAPRMFAGLQSVVDWIEDDHAMPDDPAARLEFYARRELLILNAARAAIAQATGSAS